MKKQYIEAAWAKYLDMVVPHGAGPAQVYETRKAFFAGASTLFYQVMAFRTDDKETEKQAMENMDAIDEEILMFVTGMHQSDGSMRKH